MLSPVHLASCVTLATCTSIWRKLWWPFHRCDLFRMLGCDLDPARTGAGTIRELDKTSSTPKRECCGGDKRSWGEVMEAGALGVRWTLCTDETGQWHTLTESGLGRRHSAWRGPLITQSQPHPDGIIHENSRARLALGTVPCSVVQDVLCCQTPVCSTGIATIQPCGWSWVCLKADFWLKNKKGEMLLTSLFLVTHGRALVPCLLRENTSYQHYISTELAPPNKFYGVLSGYIAFANLIPFATFVSPRLGCQLNH